MLGYIDTKSGEFIRYDADKCHPPNKPCGNACFPPDKKCGVGEKVKQIAKGVAKGAGKGAVVGGLGGAGVGGATGAGWVGLTHAEAYNEIRKGERGQEPHQKAKATRELASNIAPSLGYYGGAGVVGGAVAGASGGGLVGGIAGGIKAAKKFKKQDSDIFEENTMIGYIDINSNQFVRYDAEGCKNPEDCNCDSCKKKTKKQPKSDSLDEYFRVDSVVSYVDHSGYTVNLARLDMDQCQPPNKPCGKACFPPGKKCNVGLAKKIAKRVAVGAVVAGAGGAAYANRDKIKQGVNNIKTEYNFRKLEKEHDDLNKAFTRNNPYRG